MLEIENGSTITTSESRGVKRFTLDGLRLQVGEGHWPAEAIQLIAKALTDKSATKKKASKKKAK